MHGVLHYCYPALSFSEDMHVVFLCSPEKNVQCVFLFHPVVIYRLSFYVLLWRCAMCLLCPLVRMYKWHCPVLMWGFAHCVLLFSSEDVTAFFFCPHMRMCKVSSFVLLFKVSFLSSWQEQVVFLFPHVRICKLSSFHWIGPLGRFSHRIAMSVCLYVCMSVPCEEDLSFHWRGLLHIPPNRGVGDGGGDQKRKSLN